MYSDIKQKITAFEYEELPDGPPQQLIDGEIIISPSPLMSHQIVAGEIYSYLKDFVKKNKLGVVVFSPMDVFLNEAEVYQPDIIFISKARKEIIKKNIKGAPDLVVEVLSPSTAYYDLVHKKRIYEESGVMEFWVVDVEGRTVEVYENISSSFVPFSKAKYSETFTSKILDGLKVSTEDIFITLD